MNSFVLSNGVVFELTAYVADDGVAVLHVDTPGIAENSAGPKCRIYLNDGPIWTNPDLPDEP